MRVQWHRIVGCALIHCPLLSGWYIEEPGFTHTYSNYLPLYTLFFIICVVQSFELKPSNYYEVYGRYRMNTAVTVLLPYIA